MKWFDQDSIDEEGTSYLQEPQYILGEYAKTLAHRAAGCVLDTLVTIYYLTRVEEEEEEETYILVINRDL